MPAIRKEIRDALLHGVSPRNVGELTFIICDLLDSYILDSEDTFRSRADCIAALEVSKSEFTRLVLEPYEDEKYRQNGTVWFCVA
jgi:hypothetical protein